MIPRPSLNRAIAQRLAEEVIAWKGSDGTSRSSEPHNTHRYYYKCAICRCSEKEEALIAVVSRAVSIGEDLDRD